MQTNRLLDSHFHVWTYVGSKDYAIESYNLSLCRKKVTVLTSHHTRDLSVCATPAVCKLGVHLHRGDLLYVSIPGERVQEQSIADFILGPAGTPNNETGIRRFSSGSQIS